MENTVILKVIFIILYFYFTYFGFYFIFILLLYYDQVGFMSRIKSKSILEKKSSSVIWLNKVGKKAPQTSQ